MFLPALLRANFVGRMVILNLEVRMGARHIRMA